MLFALVLLAAVFLVAFSAYRFGFIVGRRETAPPLVQPVKRSRRIHVVARSHHEYLRWLHETRANPHHHIYAGSPQDLRGLHADDVLVIPGAFRDRPAQERADFYEQLAVLEAMSGVRPGGGGW